MGLGDDPVRRLYLVGTQAVSSPTLASSMMKTQYDWVYWPKNEAMRSYKVTPHFDKWTSHFVKNITLSEETLAHRSRYGCVLFESHNTSVGHLIPGTATPSKALSSSRTRRNVAPTPS